MGIDDPEEPTNPSMLVLLVMVDMDPLAHNRGAADDIPSSPLVHNTSAHR
jgi:hypothetical protein